MGFDMPVTRIGVLGVALGPLAAGLLAMAAVAQDGAPVEPRQLQTQTGAINDPLEDVNRLTFDVNNFFDRNLLRPVAIAYRDVVPEFARNGVRNFLDNLESPVIFANDLLQGELDRGGATMARFVINTTVGIGGLIDVAEEIGIPQHSEDFGQTLGVWGAGSGPYLMLPFLGPSNLRDLGGRVVDTGLDPLTYVDWSDANLEAFPIARRALDVIDGRSRSIETLDNLEQSSVDYYAAVRSAYSQRREDEIRNGRPQIEDLPEIE